jgi:hypothetical protein
VPIELEIDVAELEGFGLKLEASARDMERAVRTAANRTARWARTQIARGLAARLGVPKDALAGKRLTAKSGRSGAKVWIALNPLNAYKASPSQMAALIGPLRAGERRGLRAGGVDFAGAFVMTSKHGGKAAVQRRGRARFPLEAASLDVATPGTLEINSKVWPELNDRFLAFYREELDRRLGR